MAQFEYKIFSGVPKMTKGGQSIDWSEVEAKLNALVSEGWEVVSVNTASYGLAVVGSGSQEPVITFVLRKAHSTEPAQPLSWPLLSRAHLRRAVAGKMVPDRVRGEARRVGSARDGSGGGVAPARGLEPGATGFAGTDRTQSTGNAGGTQRRCHPAASWYHGAFPRRPGPLSLGYEAATRLGSGVREHSGGGAL